MIYINKAHGRGFWLGRTRVPHDTVRPGVRPRRWQTASMLGAPT